MCHPCKFERVDIRLLGIELIMMKTRANQVIISAEELQNNFDKYFNMVEEGHKILFEVNGKMLCLVPFSEEDLEDSYVKSCEAQ